MTSSTFKFAVWLALATQLAVALCSFTNAYEGTRLPWIFSYMAMPALWVLWLVSVALEEQFRPWRIGGLWILIDLTALFVLKVLFSAAAANIGPSGPGGEDVAFIIAFSPMVLPVVVVSVPLPEVGKFVLQLGHIAMSVLPEGWATEATRNWLGMSISISIPSALYVGLCRYLRAKKKDGQPEAISR